MNGFILLLSVVYTVGQGGTSSGPAASYATAQFADFRACAEAADVARKQVYASLSEYGSRPRVHAVCLPQSSK